MRFAFGVLDLSACFLFAWSVCFIVVVFFSAVGVFRTGLCPLVDITMCSFAVPLSVKNLFPVFLLLLLTYLPTCRHLLGGVWTLDQVHNCQCLWWRGTFQCTRYFLYQKKTDAFWKFTLEVWEKLFISSIKVFPVRLLLNCSNSFQTCQYPSLQSIQFLRILR